MHLHFEGAVRWSTIRELHPAGASLPATAPWLGQSRPFPDFTDFRQAFRDYVAPTCTAPEVFERHAFEIGEDLARQNVRYAEMIVSQGFLRLRTMTPAVVWKAIVRGCERAMTRYPIDLRLVLGVSRHDTPANGLATLDAVVDCALTPGWLWAIDLQGDERLGPAVAFVEIFRRAAALGLKLRAHAGEICDAASVRDAVTLCGVRQISHGVRAIEDPALVRDLVRQDVVLHVCPTSNVVLGCAASYDTHPLRQLLDAGVRCTVNSDDPLLFGSDVQNEYRVLVREMAFTPGEVGALVKNAFRASLMDRDRIDALCREVDAVLTAR
jgi:adenosine deaminase